MTQAATINVGGRLVGDGEPCFVIAEAGVNHNGQLKLALELVDVAANAGADAVKFQTFRAEKLVTKKAPRAKYQTQNTGTTESQFEMLKALELSESDHHEIVARCRQRGIVFMSTPFDEDSATFLDSLDMAVFKIPSGEVTNLPYLRHIAGLGKPIVLSTGMCTLGEVEEAIAVIERAGNRQIAILHCVSNYPAAPAESNLRAMATMKAAFGYPVGYSDHTLGIVIGVASAAMGACVLEKHFTLDRNMAGPDHAASAEPAELKQLVLDLRTVESALGTGRKRPAASEGDTAQVARKSLVAAVDIAAGTELTEHLIAIRRPGTGLAPAMKPYLINRRMVVDIAAGDLLRLEDVA